MIELKWFRAKPPRLLATVSLSEFPTEFLSLSNGPTTYRSKKLIVRSTGHPNIRQRNTTTVWNLRGVRNGFNGIRIIIAGMLNGGWKENNASDLTPSKVKTAFLYSVSAIESFEISLKIFDRMETRTVTRSIFQSQ
ncbi:hypothetical protein PGTUg99_026831 [Puccinia graminis f. sp. tritici]|uniref:Uncharacterized protein n=1 Tax=Puccinia graminis f. sp. tritici TaxID=56615 RepID=A0A5B0S048_PUCGR|nr:hypothetical protein PGTUg99_026831 [Puccinia graminis f. sp. tritici]